MTGRSLPGDLQRLLRARGTAGARSLSAGISKARSGRGRDARLEGSGSDAPPAPGPRPGPASPAQPRAPGLRADWPPRRQREEAARSRSALPEARRPRSPSAPRPGSRPSLASPSPSPPLRYPSPVPRPRWPGPGFLPGQRRLTRFPSPARQDTSPMLSLSLKQGEKTCTERRRASSAQAKLPSRAGTAADLPTPDPGCGAVRGAKRPPSPARDSLAF